MIKQIANYFQTDPKWFLRFKIDFENSNLKYLLRGILKFIYSEKATIFFEISIVDLSHVVTVKSTVEISQTFVAFSKYMNFKV